MNREEWLLAGVEKLRPIFEAQKYEIPPIQVSIGFPSKGGLSNTKRVLGECWQSSTTDDGTRHILINPLIKEGVDVLDTLFHELLHATLPDDAKHGPKFKEGMKKIGLEGPPRSATATPEIRIKLEDFVEQIGPYPHKQLKPGDKVDKPQNKSTFKFFCETRKNCGKECLTLDKNVGEDYCVTIGKKAIKLGYPSCPCGKEMMMDEADFKLYQEQNPNDPGEIT